jgi:hypothetical protein
LKIAKDERIKKGNEPNTLNTAYEGKKRQIMDIPNKDDV